MSKKEKNTNSNTKKYIAFTIVIILVVGLVGFGACKLFGDTTEENTVAKKTTNTIEGYGYTLDDLDTELYKEEFNKLKENLTGSQINYDEYAKSIAKLFIIDLYTINNKINKYDVGGTEFLEPSVVENYITNVDDTIYRYVEDNTNGKRNQNLPEVISIDVASFKSTTFKVKDENKEYEAYSVKLTWKYHVDYGYDTEGEVIVIKKDNKLYVVEKN